MTTQAASFKAFILEPFELVVGQPHQILISSASVAIVAAEAATLVPVPFNLLLAIGAEWAYLRGLISGHGIKTAWGPALNYSAVLLVVCYGALWGFRGFHLIPDTPTPWLAVLLTIIHIGTIGAVTLCSAMLHRVSMDVKALAEQKVALMVADRERRSAEAEATRIQRAQDAETELLIEMRRRDAELKLEAERNRLRLIAAAERAEQRRLNGLRQPARQPTKQPIIVDGKEYPTIRAAAEAHGISRQAMTKRLRKNS